MKEPPALPVSQWDTRDDQRPANKQTHIHTHKHKEKSIQAGLTNRFLGIKEWLTVNVLKQFNSNLINLLIPYKNYVSYSLLLAGTLMLVLFFKNVTLKAIL